MANPDHGAEYILISCCFILFHLVSCRVISPIEDPQETHGFSHEITSLGPGWGCFMAPLED